MKIHCVVVSVAMHYWFMDHNHPSFQCIINQQLWRHSGNKSGLKSGSQKAHLCCKATAAIQGTYSSQKSSRACCCCSDDVASIKKDNFYKDPASSFRTHLTCLIELLAGWMVGVFVPYWLQYLLGLIIRRLLTQMYQPVCGLFLPSIRIYILKKKLQL